MLKYFAVIIFLILSGIYYFKDFGGSELSGIFMTLYTFLFAIFTGFFIARQGRRYSSIRDQITSFDGGMSSIYRHFGHFGKAEQERVGEIITKHYKIILDRGAWDYHFINKSTTITSIHLLAENFSGDKNLNIVFSIWPYRGS